MKRWFLAAFGVAAALASGAAMARVNVDLAIGVPGVAIGGPAYYPPPPVYYAPPQPVYVAPPAPVYYGPPPVVVRPAPVYYGPRYYYGPGYGHGYYRGHGHRHYRD
ncbi:hypothetical protein [Cupriavidus plantarum]|uniref:PXPV repeat-containing protein n=1 Tax=Cupriavidus plantarum TaxID=942865 RepID=A0A316EX26_9BURK|nr:hypothetical protein [Cupriavidus plantarum]NYH99574.1 hypothetical protein [Cupriavidus plantarum]PWK36786.1 hypothetical protein C7419_101652 [Cupriavidus plantarum]REF02478.1 hypothetical protein C7418_1289 [Cupriavidus plantarum]CAG2151144.1 hypothetical protein LMG26296_04889 [Cupriavidus plantarum]SMR65874.1 hypothetical protein SAMN05421735_0737 [Cupriavidus plantarum]